MKKPEHILDQKPANRAASCVFSAAAACSLNDGSLVPIYICQHPSAPEGGTAIVCSLLGRTANLLDPLACPRYCRYAPPDYRAAAPEAT